MMASPLIAGNDIANMDAATRAILTNREVIAVDQDRLGVQGRRVWRDGGREVWVKPLAGGARAVLLLNRGEAPAEIAVDWDHLGLPPTLARRFATSGSIATSARCAAGSRRRSSRTPW